MSLKLKVSALPREDETGIKASSADPKAGREGLDVHAVEFSKTAPAIRPLATKRPPTRAGGPPENFVAVSELVSEGLRSVVCPCAASLPVGAADAW
jgi:hypothetical protein